MSLSRTHPLVVEVNRDPDATYTLHVRISSLVDTDVSTSTTTILRGETGAPASRQVIADKQM